MIKLVLLCSSKNLGDISNANAILDNLSNRFKIDERINIDISNIKALNQFHAIDHKDLVLAVGERGINFLSILDENGLINHLQTKILASLHQYDKNIEKVHLNYLSIPEAVLDSEEKKRVIGKIPGVTLTSAVPTKNPSINEIKSAYEDWQVRNKPSLDKDYILLILPGDAQDGQGTKKIFNKDSCKLLFNDVKALWQRNGARHTIILQNSPRTGKYKEDGDEEFSPNKSIDRIDPISKYFISLLESEGIKYNFYNFYDEPIENSSIFKQMLYIAIQPERDNYFILPGESVSMLGQIPLYLSGDKIIVFKPSSMNEQHEKIFEYNFNHNYLSYFNEDAEIIIPEHPVQKKEDDVKIIVNDMIQVIKSNNFIFGEACENNALPSGATGSNDNIPH